MKGLVGKRVEGEVVVESRGIFLRHIDQESMVKGIGVEG